MDKFFGHKLSAVTICGAEELPELKSYLGAFLLHAMFRVGYEPKTKALIFNFIRRIERAAIEYQEGRRSLARFVETKYSGVSAYYNALSNFEDCIAQMVQAGKLLERLPGGRSLFQEGSNLHRLNRLYDDSKHMEGEIMAGRVPPSALAAIWITNEGLECPSATMSFAELRGLMLEGCAVAEQIVHGRPVGSPAT